MKVMMESGCEEPIWNAIIDFDPQIFIWLGDNIYGDIRRPLKLFGKERTIGPWKNVPTFIPSSEHEMQARYDKAKRNDGYNRLRENVKVIGTWDDHDYGLNDAEKEFDGKITNQRLMLDFLDEPQDSPRRKQASVYASYKFGPAGRQVKVILLDTRWKGPSRWHKLVDWVQIERKRHDKERTLEEHKKLVGEILKRDQKKRKKIEAAVAC